MASSTGIRKFRWQDIEQFTVIFNEVNGISDSAGSYDVRYMRQFLSQPSCEPEENCFLAEWEDSLVGFALISPEMPIARSVASGGVLKSHRRRGIGRKLLTAAIQHARKLESRVLHIQTPSDGAAAQGVLASEGFTPSKVYWMMRWEAEEVRSVDLPPSLSFRTFKPDQDEEALTELQNSAFAQSWGFCPNSVEEISARVRLERSDPNGIVFISDGRTPIAYNWTMSASNEAGSVGWITMTGVHPDYRGRRLGAPVVVKGMEYLKAKGVAGIELEVDSENTPARELYLELGFRKLSETVWYERRLR